MSTPVTTNGHLTAAPNFCEHCGNPLTGGRFCAECGQPVARHDIAPAGGESVVADETTEERLDVASADAEPGAPAPASDAPTDVLEAPVASHAPRPARSSATAERPAQRRPNAALIVGVIAGLAVIAGAVAVVLAMGSKQEGADTAYKQKVAAAFGPVLGANRQVSDSLAHLRGTSVKGAHAANARLAVRRAQQATTLATGAITAMSAPATAGELARDARQVLDRENAYLAAVASVLARPASAATSQLPTLASNLTSALSVAGPTVAGTVPTVTGADRLASWARGVKHHQATLKAGHGHRAPSGNRNGSVGGGGGGGAPTTPTGTSCGGSVFAGPNTSCAFAFNVRDAYNDAPGSSATVQVFSPVTNQTYTMSCAPSGSGITCSGGNNASVTF